MSSLTTGERYTICGVYTGWPTGKTDGRYAGVENGHHRFEPTGAGSAAFVPADASFTVEDGQVDGDPPIVRFHPNLIGVSEVARITGLSEASVRTYVARRSIPDPLPVAGSEALVWDRSTIEEWAAARRGPGRPKGSTGA